MLRLGLLLLLLTLSAPIAEGAAIPFAGKNLFEIFSVNPREADPRAAFKAGYRTLAKRYHPDRNLGNKSAEASMKRINELMAALEKANFKPELVRLEGLAPVFVAPAPPPASPRAKAAAAAPVQTPAAKPAASPAPAPPSGEVRNPDAAAAARAYGRQYERGTKLRGCPGLFTDFSA